MLNRSAVMVRPNKPYMEWAGSLDDSGILPPDDGEQTVYLIPDYEDDSQALDILSVLWPTIFEEELMGWHTVESDWPKNRDFEMFKKWFHIKFHSIVQDLCSDPIEDDEE